MLIAEAISPNSSCENGKVDETRQKRGDRDQSGHRLFQMGAASLPSSPFPEEAQMQVGSMGGNTEQTSALRPARMQNNACYMETM